MSSILNIEEDTVILIAGQKNRFDGLKTSKLFKVFETANDMLNRIVEQSPINFDAKSSMQDMS